MNDFREKCLDFQPALSAETLVSGDFDHVQYAGGETVAFNSYLQKKLINMLI